MDVRSAILSAVVLVALTMAAVPAAGADLGPVETLMVRSEGPYGRNPEVHVCCLTVAGDASGNTVYVWWTIAKFTGTHITTVYAQTRSAAGVLGPTLVIARNSGMYSSTGVWSPGVAVDARGSALIAWRRTGPTPLDHTIDVRRLSARGVLGTTKTIARDLLYGTSPVPRVTAGSNGVVAVSWLSEEETSVRLQARMQSAGVFGPLRNVSPVLPATSSYDVAIGADGQAIFAWSAATADAGDRIKFRLMPFAGELSRMHLLSGGRREHAPAVRVDPAGNAVFAWIRTASDSSGLLRTRVRSSDGVLTAVQTVSPRTPDSLISAHDVVVAANGTAVYLWLVQDGAAARLQARMRSAAGDLGPIEDIARFEAPARHWSVQPRLAADALGNAVFAWIRGGRVRSRTLSASGVLGDVQPISAQGASLPSVVVDARGNAVFAWTRRDGPNVYVETRARSAD